MTLLGKEAAAAANDILRPSGFFDGASDAWLDCCRWLFECRPDVATLLNEGRLREAMGIAFLEGVRRGELRAYFDPGRHHVYGDVDGGAHPAPLLLASRKRRQDHATANGIVRAEISRVMGLPPINDSFEVKKLCLCSRVELHVRMKKKKVLKAIAERSIPLWWPLARPGPKPRARPK